MTQRPGIRPLRQQGAAAVEFAVVATLMIVLLMGMLVWWRYFETSQIVAKAAGDGARAAHTLVITGAAPCVAVHAAANQAAIEARVESIIRSQLIYSGLSENRFTISDKSWTCVAAHAQRFSFNVSYRLPSLLPNENWLAEPAGMDIKDKIVVHFPAKT